VVGAIAYNVPRFFEFETNYVQVTGEDRSNHTDNDTKLEETWEVSIKLYDLFSFFFI
jgi:hypothetical protein